MRPVKVLVVDDSMVFRNMLVQGLNKDPNIEVVAEAEDPFQARDAILKYKPDVMTLDIEMPKMSGIEFLKKLMPQYPIPVVMLSSLSDKVFDALDAGAVDFVNKPDSLDRVKLNAFFSQELATKVKIASTAKVGKLKRAAAGSVLTSLNVGKDRVVAIGASTGGTEAIFEVVKNFRRDIPGVVIVQHMPPGFTKMYAERLNNQCEVAVKEAQTGDRVMPGMVLIAPGDRHMRLVKVGREYQVECSGTDKVNGHCPSVDVLFHSDGRTGRSLLHRVRNAQSCL